MSRAKPNGLQKIEKETENKNIKRKLKIVPPKAQTGVIYHTVADNVERAGPLPEKKRSLSPRKGRLGSHVYSRNPTPEPDPYIKSIGIFPNHKPLSPYVSTVSSKTRVANKNGKSSIKAKPVSIIKDTKIEEENVVTGSKDIQCTGSVLELYTPRNGLSLQDSSSDNKCKVNVRISPRKASTLKTTIVSRSPRIDITSLSSGSSTYLNLELDISSLDSPESKTDIFHTAPLLVVPTAPPSMESSATLIRKFRNVLELQKKTMPDDEIKVIKEVLKTDERSTLLRSRDPDANLFTDILKTQLQGIVQHEKIVKTALKKLGSLPRQEYVEETEFCDLQKMRSIQRNIASERNISTKHQRKMSFSPDVFTHSDDNSLKQKPSFEFHEMSLFQERCDNMTHAQNSTRRDKPNNFSEKVVNLKRCGNPFEDFVNSTLPLKRRKVISGKLEASQMSSSRDRFHDDFEINVVRNELSEKRDHRRSKSARRPQVDVTFKNVPSLEKEILILKALGERLEATLKRTLSEPSLSDLCEKKGEMSSNTSLTKELQRIDSSIQVYAGRRTPICPQTRMMHAILWRQAKAGMQVFSKGLRHEIGIVYEFLIVSKTIDELKSDAESNFYIPMMNKSGVLERTTFKQLTEEPNEFLRHLKPKNNNLVFNVLDHDPLFFNSFLLPNLKSSIHSDKSKTDSSFCNSSKGRSRDTIVMFEGGDSLTQATEGLTHLYRRPDPISSSAEIPTVPILKKTTITTKTTATNTNSHHVEKLTVRVEVPKPQSPPLIPKQLPPVVEKPTDMQIRSVKRNRKRRVVTPMPLDAYDEPKNNLLKTILVGTVQISLFLVLIMAITYPDIKC